MKLKTVCLDKTFGIPVILLPTKFFLEKLKSEDHFVYLKVNHGFFDRMAATNYKKPLSQKNIKEFVKLLYPKRGPYHSQLSETTYTSLVLNMFSYFFEDELDYVYLGLSNSNGMKNNQDSTPKCQKRTKYLKNLIDNSSRDFFIHGGVVRHWVVTGEIEQLIQELNKDKYNLILIGPKYLNEYKFFNSFYHIQIPDKNAGNMVQDIKKDIIDHLNPNKHNVVLGSTALLGFSIANIHKDHKLTYIDIGRSMDILVKNKIPKQPWFRLPVSHWANQVKKIRSTFKPIGEINLK